MCIVVAQSTFVTKTCISWQTEASTYLGHAGFGRLASPVSITVIDYLCLLPLHWFSCQNITSSPGLPTYGRLQYAKTKERTGPFIMWMTSMLTYVGRQSRESSPTEKQVCLMLPLATHWHTCYHFHPFYFVLLKLKDLVAKQHQL